MKAAKARRLLNVLALTGVSSLALAAGSYSPPEASATAVAGVKFDGHLKTSMFESNRLGWKRGRSSQCPEHLLAAGLARDWPSAR
jgi:hypothetical protein